MKATITLQFGELGYVACPYWPEIEWLVMLEKKAGLHPKHSDTKRKQLLETYCGDQGIGLETVQAARDKIANEHWYRDAAGKIIVPRHHFSAALVQSLSTHPLKKTVGKDQLRSFVTVGDLIVEPAKTKADGQYQRYVKNPDSNLRRFATDEYIADFIASGEVHFAPEAVEADMLESLIRFAGRWVGVGSCRKMGRGKYELLEFDAK